MNLDGKTVVIFGCGYLGTRVARAAQAAGARVSALTRNPERAEELRGEGLHQVVVGRFDTDDWHSKLESRQDFVLDCVSSGGGGLEGYRKSYVEGMRSILHWAECGEIGTLVFTSSTSVYAQSDGKWVTETDPAEGVSEGGRILLQAEELLKQAAPEVRRRFILRLGGIYGPERHRLLDRALAGAAPADGDATLLNSIHVDDAVLAILTAFLSPAEVDGGVFNIVDGNPAPKGEIMSYLRERARQMGMGPVSDAFQSRRRRGFRPNRRISSERAREVLGWKPAYANYQAGYEAIFEGLQRRDA